MATILDIALVQSEIFWHNPENNRRHFASLIDGIDKKVDLIVLPETFTTGFTMTPSEIDPSEGNRTLTWMKEVAREKRAAIAGSIPFFEGGKYTNRLLFVEPDGKSHHYDKRHTFTLAGEHRSYARGESKVLIEYCGFRICPMICYDLRFPVWTRNTEDYDLLFFVANWPKPRIDAWDTLLKARAIENMAYCIGVNRVGTDDNGYEYVGHSACYDPLGHRVAFSDRDEVLYVKLDKSRIKEVRDQLRFLDDRDEFILQ
ncbi:amidohydrolase [Muriicola marianensis]|uniref:Nitrilase family protein n=1 Tax=Muriicola marianensis TaxID=1324801 RepID=A0ABQ1R074_9FLAO|nr:amidohydrolase [Muriicola marianensis]GGD51820.1 nitrilase family protein [Muriicola marianensis]